MNILFLSSEPSDACRLRLNQELRDVREKLQISRERDNFLLISRESVRPGDITQAILDIEPHIVHFSGHGLSTGELCFENASGKAHPVKPSALSSLFELLASQVHCVLLNACYSEIQAKAISQHIPYVIGMNQAIGDKAAITFSVGFYKVLGAGRSFEDAYRFACVEIELEGISEHLTPVIYIKQETNSNVIQTDKCTTLEKFVGNQTSLTEQLAFFSQNIGLTHPRQDYTEAQFEAYCRTWKKLQALRLAGDNLWEKANEDNIIKFANYLKIVTQIIHEEEIFFEEKDRLDLLEILNIFTSFRVGKVKLITLRSKQTIEEMSRSWPDLHRFEKSVMRQIQENYDCKLQYDNLLENVRDSFKRRLSSH